MHDLLKTHLQRDVLHSNQARFTTWNTDRI